jgi:hypothetical protein
MLHYFRCHDAEKLAIFYSSAAVHVDSTHHLLHLKPREVPAEHCLHALLQLSL